MKFHTDNAAPCFRCQSTIATYDVDEATSLVDVFCHGCHQRDTFDRGRRQITTAAEASAAHRATYPQGGPAKAEPRVSDLLEAPDYKPLKDR
jgi:hypothetical protein